ncbi:MAG: competence protein ComK [Breznakia sp.]
MEKFYFKHIYYVYDDYKSKQCIVCGANHERAYFTLSSKTVVKRLCKSYGGDVEFQRHFAYQYLRYHQHVPIILKAGDNYVMIPFGNMRKRMLWINYEYIKCVKRYKEAYCKILVGERYVYIYMHKRSVVKRIKRVRELLKVMDKL